MERVWRVRIPLALQALFGRVLKMLSSANGVLASGYLLHCKPCSDEIREAVVDQLLKPIWVRIPLALQALFGLIMVFYLLILRVMLGPDTSCTASPVRTDCNTSVVISLVRGPDTSCTASPVRTLGSNASGCRIGSRTSLSTLSATLCV